MQKDIEYLRMSNFFLTGEPQSPSGISSISASKFDFPEAEAEDSWRSEISSLQNGPNFDPVAAQVLRRRVSGFLEDLDLKLEWSNVSGAISSGVNGDVPSDFSKNIPAISSPAKSDTNSNGMPVGKMWEKIKSLEAYIKQLEGERSASRLVEMELEQTDDKDVSEDVSEEETAKVPPPPLPPMMPPPPPLVPGMVPKLSTDPALDKIPKSKLAMKVNLTS